MVSCGVYGDEESMNIITIAWTGTVNSDPPMTYISVRPERHSYGIINKNRDFVINLTTEKLAFQTDYCGVKSGRDIKKFSNGLTPHKSEKVKSPSIKESPVNIECVVTDVIPLGTHDMFLAKVVSVSVDEQYIDENGRFDLALSKPICYSHGEYFTLGDKLGKFGYSVQKKKKKKK